MKNINKKIDCAFMEMCLDEMEQMQLRIMELEKKNKILQLKIDSQKST